MASNEQMKFSHCSENHILFSLFTKVVKYRETRLPSNPAGQRKRRMRTFSYADMVTFGQVDKGGSHTIRPAIAQNPMLHENSMALFYRTADLLPIEVSYSRNRDFRPFLLL